MHQLRSDMSGLEVINIALPLKVVLTLIPLVGVALVTTTYILLDRRSGFMASVSIFPTKVVQENVGRLLSVAWPDNPDQLHSSPKYAITLFHLGSKTSHESIPRVANWLLQSTALSRRASTVSPRYVESGAPLTNWAVQILIWEWISLWLVALMLFTILTYNGFFTNTIMLDSYPRLAITLIYTCAFLIHAIYIWRIILRFYTNVAAGCAWNLLDSADFAIAERGRLACHSADHIFEFRSIDRGRDEHSPKILPARFEHDASCIQTDTQAAAPDAETPDAKASPLDEEYAKDLAAANKHLSEARLVERDTAYKAAEAALSYIFHNAMILISITLLCGFNSWIAQQTTANTPNNFSSAKIGSLALLGSLSTGAGLMFLSALKAGIMNARFRKMLSLREVRINGNTIAHDKRLKFQYESVAFSGGEIARCCIRFWDVVEVGRKWPICARLLIGPAIALLPEKEEPNQTDGMAGVDIKVKVRQQDVVLTTHGTGGYAKAEEQSV